MKLNKFFLMVSSLLIVFICIGSVAAIEDNNSTDDLLNLENNDYLQSDFNMNSLSTDNDESILSASKTISVDNAGESHREMNDHTIRNAISSASSGDTIIVNGANYDHVHIVIDKKLTIKSTVGTTLSHCSNQGTSDSGHQGIFYITSKASGTVIEGFDFSNDDGMLYDRQGYAILINGASDVVIKNCTFSNNGAGDAIRLENAKSVSITDVAISDALNGIRIVNSQNTNIKNSNISDSDYGICDVNSSKTVISSNNVLNNKVSGISVEGSSNNLKISYNNITSNDIGISLTSSKNIDILSNYIALNPNYGVYIDCPVVQINIIGNFFYRNSFSDGGGEIYNGPGTKGLFKEGGEKLEVVNNNYFVGDNVRVVNAASSGAFLAYAFEINENVNCPIIHYKYESALWSSGNYRLELTEIKQSKKGIYSVSIVDANGNVAKGLSSVPVTFYLNKDNNYVAPQEGDVFKTVMMRDGTATVRFYADEFKASGNVVTAVLPGISDYLTGDQNKNLRTFEVDDASIPGNVTGTKISVSNLNTYPKSNANFAAILTDVNDNPVSGQEIIFTVGSTVLKATTDSNGKATVKISKNAGTYDVKIRYDGDEVDYEESSASAKIIVKKASTKIVASNYAMLIKKADYYKLTLKDSSNNPVSGQKITIKVNKKTYTVKTNKKGVAKLKLKLKKGTYKVVMKFKGNSKFLASKKTAKITVKKVLKTKLTAPKIKTYPKTQTKYTVTLKNENGVALSKQRVTVKVNGKTYTKKTNSKGQVTIKVKFSKLKDYKVKTVFKGSKIYKKSSKTGKITVQKMPTKIEALVMESFPNTAKDYTVTLKTSSGKAISKQSLKISLNGHTYTKTTNSKGQVAVNTKFSDEGTYRVDVIYSGSGVYKNSKAAGTIKVSRTQTQLIGYDRTFSKGSSEFYTLTLKDDVGNPLKNQNISCILDNAESFKCSDENGQINVDVSALDAGSYQFNAIFGQTNRYASSSASHVITISNKTGVTFIDKELPGDEIQARLDKSEGNVEFLGNMYSDVSLVIDRPLNITFMPGTVLNGKINSPVLTVLVSNFNISGLTVNASEASGIIIRNAENVIIENNVITNVLNQSRADSYMSGESLMPGCGVELQNAGNVTIINNDVSSFENAIFAQDSYSLKIKNNTLYSSNYGINYGEGVKNTEITGNLITKNVGLYVMNVPEGPLGYGIFLNQSAVNVSITHNRILDNYMGISVDSNYSTGIVITGNWISDNALEGIRFNAGYDLAENAVEPDVNDNAIYRNAKGPSMMILGELSANPEGIYQYGPEDDTKKLQLGANWFGKNARVTWDYDKNITGYGTMCPRINAIYISVGDIEIVSPAKYSITFYKYGEIASKLPEFEMYATLNDNIEQKFNVVGGVGVFEFDNSDLSSSENVIKISIGSLSDQYRTFEVLLEKTL